MAELSVADDVAARLASYKTPKQRRQRMKQLRMLDDGSGYMDMRDCIEKCFLGLQLKDRRVLVTKQLVQEYVDSLRRATMSGEVKIAVNIEGEHYRIRPPGRPN